jgi:hypothetical protein
VNWRIIAAIGSIVVAGSWIDAGSAAGRTMAPGVTGSIGSSASTGRLLARQPSAHGPSGPLTGHSIMPARTAGAHLGRLQPDVATRRQIARPSWAPKTFRPTALGMPAPGLRGRRKKSPPPFVAQVNFPGKPGFQLKATSIDVVENGIAAAPSVPAAVPSSTSTTVLQIKFNAAAEQYWHRLIAAELGTKPFARATVFLFTHRGGRTIITYTLQKPAVTLDQFDGYANSDALTLTAKAWSSKFTGRPFPLPETKTGQVGLTYKGAVEHSSMGQFEDTAAGAGRAITVDLAVNRPHQAYFQAAFGPVTIDAWTNPSHSQALEYHLTTPNGTMEQLDDGTGLIDRLTLQTDGWTVSLKPSKTNHAVRASAPQNVGTISIPTANPNAPLQAPLIRLQFNFNSFVTPDQRYGFYLEVPAGKAGLALMSPTLTHADLTAFHFAGGKPLEKFSVDNLKMTYSANSTGSGVDESISVTTPTVAVTVLTSPQDNPKSPAGALVIGGVAATTTEGSLYLYSGGGGASQDNAELPSGVFTTSFLTGTLASVSLLLHDGALHPHGPVATHVLGTVGLNFYQYYPGNGEPFTDHVDFYPKTTTSTFSAVTGAHKVKPVGILTLHTAGGDMTAPLEDVSGGVFDQLVGMSCTLATGTLSKQLLSGPVDATVVIFTKPGGQKLSQYELKNASVQMGENDYGGHAVDQASLLATTHTLTYTGRLGAYSSPTIGSVSVPAGSPIHMQPVFNLGIEPEQATAGGLEVSIQLYIRSAPLDNTFFQAELNNSALAAVGLALTKHGHFMGTLNDLKIFEADQGTSQYSTETSLSVTATIKS